MLWGNRNGFFYVLDRSTGEFLLGKPFVKQTWASGLDDRGRPLKIPGQTPTAEGTLIYPGVQGGTNWYAPSFSPRTGFFYLTAWDDYPGVYYSWNQEYERGKWYAGGSVRAELPSTVRQEVRTRGPESGYGAIRALNPATGERVWEYRMSDVSDSGLLTTATDLLFSGNREGHFFALNALNGKLLWTRYLGGQVAASPITWSVDGRQYIIDRERTCPLHLRPAGRVIRLLPHGMCARTRRPHPPRAASSDSPRRSIRMAPRTACTPRNAAAARRRNPPQNGRSRAGSPRPKPGFPSGFIRMFDSVSRSGGRPWHRSASAQRCSAARAIPPRYSGWRPRWPWRRWRSEEHLTRLLAPNHGVQPAQVRKDFVDLAQQEAERIDEVDSRLVHQQARVVAKERLAVEIRILAPAIPHAHQKVNMGEFANRARLLDLADLAVPRLPPPVLMDHEADAGRSRRLHNAAAGLEVRRQGLLADDGDSARSPRRRTSLRACPAG